MVSDRTAVARAHVLVSGLVQGVNFRWYTAEHARSRDVSGWVRNLDDGRVEAVFEGAEQHVSAMVEWCREGPRHARVSSVDVSWEQPEGLSGFDLDW
jgi:acylphosphatase